MTRLAAALAAVALAELGRLCLDTAGRLARWGLVDAPWWRELDPALCDLDAELDEVELDVRGADPL